jgi:hypothetical protein
MRQPKDGGQPCLHPACTPARRMQPGNGRARATSLTPSGKRRLWRGHPGATHVAVTRETVFCDRRTSAAQSLMALQRRLGHVDRAGRGVVLGVPQEMVVAWRQRAASQAAVIHRPLWCKRPVPQGQLDEMRKGTGKRGHRCEPYPDLVSGQLVKQKKQGKLLTLSTHAVLGAERLTHLGCTISISWYKGLPERECGATLEGRDRAIPNSTVE